MKFTTQEKRGILKYHNIIDDNLSCKHQFYEGSYRTADMRVSYTENRLVCKKCKKTIEEWNTEKYILYYKLFIRYY